MSGIKRSPEADFMIGAIEMEPEHSGNAGNTPIADAHDELEGTVPLALPGG